MTWRLWKAASFHVHLLHMITYIYISRHTGVLLVHFRFPPWAVARGYGVSYRLVITDSSYTVLSTLIE